MNTQPWSIEPSRIGRIAVPPALPDGHGVLCTTRDFPGRLNGSVAGEITAAVRDRFGIDCALTTCTQVHGAAAARAHSGGAWRECDSCDALWSGEDGVALGIKIADCLPVALIDPAHGVIANVHSGWRGAAQNIVARTIEEVSAATMFDAAEAFAYLGPSIRACCFEVGEEVASQFDPRYAVRSGAKPHIDLVAFTADVLRSSGLPDERVFDSGLCTRCDGSIFHSFRRDAGGGGRNLMIAAR